MMTRKRAVIAGISLLVVILMVMVPVFRGSRNDSVAWRALSPHRGNITTFISTTGTVNPQNRLEIKPAISGRVERILVNEGDHVRTGQTLIWMSSTDRAALIDAARAQGSDQLKYWEQIYKPIPIVAPITGMVIVRDVEPGQTVTSTTAMLVLSDRLIVEANVDETDIGRVKTGQTAEMSLDAYPDVKTTGRVSMIKYESTVVNNVTTYQVNIVPDKVPPVFKSGMSANISIFEKTRKNVLLLPNDAIQREDERTYVLVSAGRDLKREKRPVRTGLEDERYTEILSGLTEKDRVVVMEKKYVQADKDTGKNPFLPSRKK